MATLLRRIIPISPSKAEIDDDEYNVEYSFAMEYTGPPVSYHIPRAAPVDIGQIPTANPVDTASMLSNLSLPVIEPIVRSNPTNKRLSSESNSIPTLVSDTHSLEVADSDALGLISSNVESPQLPNGDESSSSLGFSDSHEGSQNNCNCEIHGLELSSSQASTCDEEAPRNDNKGQIVTFCENALVHLESDHYELDIVQERRNASSRVKKGLCHRCLKGNRFTGKEICLVCDAKYCSVCVLRAMGSMPEGRKCTMCIGYPIDELKRKNLGKCSRMLKLLLTDYEVKQKMQSEVSCQANQLPYWLVIVNGNPLSLEQLVLLQSCANPPKRLRPGSYWYDKVAGFWGKEGQKPSDIISHQLAIGGPIRREASNGNTNVLINSREITTTELLMLQLARINCDGCPHFWVSHNGSYLEEGQNQDRGKIWEKTGIKTICALLSLPIPPASAISSGEDADIIGKPVGENYDEKKSLTKLLLVGHNQSGTSTLFKQAKILYNVPFSEDERRNVKLLIQSNLYGYLGILLDGRKQFEEECSIEIRRKLIDQPSTSAAGSSSHIAEKNIYSISPGLKAFSDWLLQVMMSGNLENIFPAATREYAPLVEDLWRDKAFQATYDRRNELQMLPRVANYFLPRAVEISRPNYEPSDMDILYADGITSSNGLTCTEFSFPRSPQPQDSYMEPAAADQNQSLPRYQLIRVHSSSLGENCKWLEMFEDVDLILFCIDLTSYDEFYENNDGLPRNKMLESRKLFKTIVSHPSFQQKDFLLVLNKIDLLEEKIEQAPLTQCEWFHDFNPVISLHNKNNKCRKGNNSSLGQCAFQYIASKFKREFDALTGRKLYVTSVMGLEADSVDATLKYGREILKWVDEENKPNNSANEWSSESLETSS